MVDRREQIMARLHEVVNGVDSLKTVFRNVIITDERQLPAASILEGDEEVSNGGVVHGRSSNRPYVVTATPLVLLRVQSNEAGEDFNYFRAAIIKAVLEDATLDELSLNNRGVRYVGMNTTEHAARQMVGAGTLQFSITYNLNPSEL